MSADVKELFAQTYGPFSQAILAIFKRSGRGFCLSFDQGPEYDYQAINSETSTVFKFPSGVMFELRVTQLSNRSLQFHGTQLPELLLDEDLAGPPVPVCGSEDCAEVIPCPDPTTPIMICTGGVARCVSDN